MGHCRRWALALIDLWVVQRAQPRVPLEGSLGCKYNSVFAAHTRQTHWHGREWWRKIIWIKAEKRNLPFSVTLQSFLYAFSVCFLLYNKKPGMLFYLFKYVTFWHDLSYLQQPKKISIDLQLLILFRVRGRPGANPMVDGVFMLAVFNITSSGACYRTICIHLKEAQHLSFSEYCSGFLCVNSRNKEKWLRDDVAVVRVYWRLKRHDTPWTCHQSIAGLEYALY